jgi:hypothetical protein
VKKSALRIDPAARTKIIRKKWETISLGRLDYTGRDKSQPQDQGENRDDVNASVTPVVIQWQTPQLPK